jgi:hypothetical protein
MTGKSATFDRAKLQRHANQWMKAIASEFLTPG